MAECNANRKRRRGMLVFYVAVLVLSYSSAQRYPSSGNDSRSQNSLNPVPQLIEQGWQLVAHQSSTSENERKATRPSNYADTLLPSTSFGSYIINCSANITLPVGSDSSFQRPFSFSEEIQFRTGRESFAATSQYPLLHDALTNDALDWMPNSESVSSSESSSVLADGTIVSQVGFWFQNARRQKTYFTPGLVWNRRTAYLGPLITVDARHVGGVGSIVLLWGDSTDLEIMRDAILNQYGHVTNSSAAADDDYSNRLNEPEVLVLSETHNGINVLVRGGQQQQQQQEDVVLLRNPLLERGWELVAHASNQGDFVGDGVLYERRNYNIQHATWAPLPWTPDFFLDFPIAKDNQGDWEVLFLTGDTTLWVLVEHYEVLRDRMQNSYDISPNFDFVVGYPEEGIVERSRGNVMAPWITYQGSHIYGLQHGSIIWGGATSNSSMARDDSENNAYTTLKNKRGGINVYVRTQSLWQAEINRITSSTTTTQTTQTFYPCTTNNQINLINNTTTSTTDTNNYYDANDRSGNSDNATIINDPLLPGEPATDDTTPTPTSTPTFNPTTELDRSETPISGDGRDGLFDLDPSSPSTSPTTDVGLFISDEGGVFMATQDTSKYVIAAAVGSTAAVIFVISVCMWLRRDNFKTRRDRVQDAAGAFITQSKCHFGEAVESQIRTKGLGSTFDSADDVSSIGGTQAQLMNPGDPSRRWNARYQEDAEVGLDSLATFDDDYYPANVGFGTDTVISSVGGTYGGVMSRLGDATLMTTTLHSAVPAGPEDILHDRIHVSDDDSDQIMVCDLSIATEDEASFEDQFVRCLSNHESEVKIKDDPLMLLQPTFSNSPKIQSSSHIKSPKTPRSSNRFHQDPPPQSVIIPSPAAMLRSKSEGNSKSIARPSEVFRPSLGRPHSFMGTIPFNHLSNDSSTMEYVQWLDVTVRPGKLGVVLQDGINGGPPLFSCIKDSSIVAGMIFKNDALVAVDDEDCTLMTALAVSRLIMRKKDSVRKLTILRRVGNVVD